MEALNSKYEYILERGRMLTIPLVRWEDHELNKDIKQEITDENCHNNDDSILKIGKTQTIEKEVNTTNINIKSEENIIDACQFDGSVLNEDNSLEIIERPNLRNNLSCTANCRTNPRKTQTIEKEVNTTNINIKSEENIIDACQFDGSVLNEDNSLEIIERPNLRNNLSCTANCRTNPRKTQTIEKEVNTTNINIKSEENIIDACQFDGSVLNEDNSLEIIERPNLRNNLSCTANCRTNPRKTQTIEKEVNTTNINIKSEENIIDACQCDVSVLNEDNSLEIIERSNLRNNLSCTANCRTNPRNTRSIETEVNTTNINIKTEEDIFDASTYDGSVLNEDNSLKIIDHLNSRDNLREDTSISNTNDILTRHIIKIRFSEMDEALICAMCNEFFYKKSHLKKHLLCHTRENSYNNRVLCYNCNICGKRFSQYDLLETHMRFHNDEKPLVCDVCNKRFGTKSGIFKHMRTHTGEKPYKCDVCDEKFSHSRKLNVHKMIHTGEKPFFCDICKKGFTQSAYLKNHTKTHTDEKPYKCEVCDKSFAVGHRLNEHRRTHTGEKPYKCDTCNKTFSIAKSLKVHRRIHTGETPYKCSICSKGFRQRSVLTKHIRTHVNDKQYICDICKKMFSQPEYLKIHTMRHAAEKLYKCKLCDMSFALLEGFKRHKRTHTGEKPYACLICGRNFAQSSNLILHTRVHTGERPYKCNYCDKAFYDSSDLKRHTKTHTKDNKCKICNKEFTLALDKKRHMKTHNAEMPYKCVICDKGFSRLGNLNAHKKIHLKKNN